VSNLTPEFSIGQEVWCLQLDAEGGTYAEE